MKVSAPLLVQLLLASSTGARLFQKTTEVNNASKNEEDIDRIINGVEAKEDRYSYHVSLRNNKYPRNKGTFVVLYTYITSSTSSCAHT